MKKSVLLCLSLVLLLSACRVKQPAVKIPAIRYEISFENRIHHEALVQVSFQNIRPGPFMVQMSRTSPGRYNRHDFIKNVYQLRARDEKGRLLTTNRKKPHQWQISGHNGSGVITYRLYGDQLNGTYNCITDKYVLINMPAALIWSKEWQDQPLTIKIKKPLAHWHVLTQLPEDKQPDTYYAPHLAYLLDSPFLMGQFQEQKWTVKSNGKSYQFILAVNHLGQKSEVKSLADLLKKVVREQIAVFGELPDFDYGSYLFLANYLPNAQGDGMEHRNSTVITRYNDLKNYKRKFLVTLSHEFFHSWNMERLRPASLKPFDFNDINMCPELWFAEGATTYYDDLFITRAGIKNIDLFAESFNLHLNRFLKSPVIHSASPVEISMMGSVFDQTDFEEYYNPNIYLSYYDYGEIICLALDLTLRSRFNHLSLDDLMKRLWEKYGRDERPYSNEDLKTTLAELTRDDQFANRFFNDHIYGIQKIDLNQLLSHAGLVLINKGAKKAGLGDVVLWSARRRAVIKTNTIIGTPLYQAGLDRGDEIIQLGRHRIYGAYSFNRALRYFRPGQTTTIVYSHDHQIKKSRITFKEKQDYGIITNERAGLPITEPIKIFRKNWLSSKVNLLPEN